MIENSFVTVHSDGKTVTVNYYEDGGVREGPATFPARYASFAALIQYVETQFNGHILDTAQLAEIQGFLGSPWPSGTLKIAWENTALKAEASPTKAQPDATPPFRDDEHPMLALGLSREYNFSTIGDNLEAMRMGKELYEYGRRKAVLPPSATETPTK